jgi:hypothetical protein
MNYRLVGAATVFTACALGGFAHAAGTSTDPVLITTRGGDTMARRNRFLSWHPIDRGRPLPADSELTCSAGCTVRTSDGSTLTLDPGAHISVSQTTFVPMGGPFAALGRRFELIEGAVTAHVVTDPKRPRTIVLGTQNDGFVAVKAGDAQIVAAADRAGVACLQGGARVKQGKSAVDLRAGEATSLARTGVALTTHPLEAAPTWAGPTGKLDDPQPLAVAIGDRPGAPAVAWLPVRGATGYRVEVAGESSFATVLEAARVGANQSHYAAKSLGEGSYFARIVALDADGVASRPSEPTALRVISVRTPPGGYADADHATVVAPEGTSLRFSDNAKLEMAVDDHKFSPASTEFVADGAPHVVRLRVAGDFGRESRVFVEPRALRADVRVGPAYARWPDDAVAIAVDIHDASGRFDPASVTPDLQVLVGVEPVQVEWKREGSVFTARLAPKSVNGPEVVRVIVHDQSGALLGRNFLEIEPSFSAVRSEKQLAQQ